MEAIGETSKVEVFSTNDLVSFGLEVVNVKSDLEVSVISVSYGVTVAVLIIVPVNAVFSDELSAVSVECIVEKDSGFATSELLVISNAFEAIKKTDETTLGDVTEGVCKIFVAEETACHGNCVLKHDVCLRFEGGRCSTVDNTCIIAPRDHVVVVRIIKVSERGVVVAAFGSNSGVKSGHKSCHLFSGNSIIGSESSFGLTLDNFERNESVNSGVAIVFNINVFESANGESYCCKHSYCEKHS